MWANDRVCVLRRRHGIERTGQLLETPSLDTRSKRCQGRGDLFVVAVAHRQFQPGAANGGPSASQGSGGFEAVNHPSRLDPNEAQDCEEDLARCLRGQDDAGLSAALSEEHVGAGARPNVAGAVEP